MDEANSSSGFLRSPGSRWLAGIAIAVAIAYGAISIAVQAGPQALAKSLLGVGAGAFLGAIVLGALKFRVSTILAAGIVPLALWVGLWGSYSFERDLLGGALALTLAWPATRLATHWRHTLRGSGEGAEELERPRRRFMRRFVLIGFVLIGFVLIWIVNSGLDLLFESHTEPREWKPLGVARAKHAPFPAVRVGVALSGGGYRAALMHAGVLAELDAMRIPVTAVSSVSGGSIIGSFYAAGGAPDTFRAAVAGGRFKLRRDMADMHNALRLPFPLKIPYLDVALLPWLRFGRVDVQANLVDRVLLGGTTVRDMQTPERPRLQICATDLRTGSGVGLSSDGVTLRSPAKPALERNGGTIPYDVKRSFHPAIDPETRIADLVAASGAFPGAFSAVELTLPKTGTHSALPLLLADGGIVDNWGVGLLLDRFRSAAANDPWRLDLLIISAGGRVFEVGEDVPGPEQLRRAIDIVYETAGWHPIDLIGAPDRPPMLLLQPQDADPQSPEYRTFSEANTLTDDFSERDARHLFDLGRQLVRDASGSMIALLKQPLTP